MGQLRLLLLLYVRPLRAMSGIIDEGSLLLAAGLVLVASALTSGAMASQIARAVPFQAGAAVPAGAGDADEQEYYDENPTAGPPLASGTPVPSGGPAYPMAAAGFLSATASFSTIFALALLYSPFVLLLVTVFEPIGSFGVAFRRDFGPF